MAATVSARRSHRSLRAAAPDALGDMGGNLCRQCTNVHSIPRTGNSLLSLLLLAASPEIIPKGQIFSCTPTRVWDGDGPIWCAEGPRLRLAGIAAREIDGTCRSNQPCPTASAEQARDALVMVLGRPIGRSREGHVLIRGQTLRCRSEGRAGGSRTSAWCTSSEKGDVSCAMVGTGTVLRWQRYWRNHSCR